MEIKDSGRGIRQEDIGKLFQNYFQFDREANKDIEGVGLGLAISRNLINAMGGDIAVESEYGNGSLFTVSFPQKIHRPDEIAIVDDPGDKTVLLYEVNSIYTDSILRTLSNLNVGSELVKSDGDLRSAMESGKYKYIFLSHKLFNKNKETILEFGANSLVVILAEFGESVSAGQWSTLSMPVHAVSVAGVLNRISSSYLYSYKENLTVGFIAPDAKVLIVDDINTNLKVAYGLMSPYRMKVDTKSNGMDAIEAVKSERYDLVFMDHRMPGMDGVEATQHIRALGGGDPYYNELPIVALTANAVSGMKEMFLGSGFNDFMSKPIDTVKLNSVLEKWIPKEKKTYPVKKESITHNTDCSAQDIKIDGLDISKGIEHSGGKPEYYYETLATFLVDGYEHMRDIGRCLEAGNMKLFVTHIHALKSASANVGATKVSEAAYALEKAGLNGDLNFISTNIVDFRSMTMRILGNIDNGLKARFKSSEMDGDSLDTAAFASELGNLSEALGTMDFNEINRSVEALLNIAHADKVIDEVRQISRHILMAEYDEAETLTAALLAPYGLLSAFTTK